MSKERHGAFDSDATSLRQPEADLRRLFDSNIIGILFADKHGNVVDANAAVLQMLGYGPDDRPLPWDRITPPEDRPLREAKARELETTGVATPWETDYIARDGRRVPVLTGATRVQGPDFECVGFVIDLTDSKRAVADLRRSEARYRSLYDNIPLMYFTLNDEGVVRSVNRHGAATLGYTPEELVGHPVQSVFHEDDRKAATEGLGNVLRTPGEVRVWELRKVRKDGSVLWVHDAVRAVQGADGDITILVACRDISQRKETERRIREHQEQLQHLTLELTLTEERERRRIAVGLHDDIGHSLAIAQLKLGELRNVSEKHSAEIGEIGEILAGATQASRVLTFDLASPLLYELGLEAALQDVGEKIIKNNGMGFRFETDGQDKRPGDDISVLLYRVARELLINTLKHAQARNATIDVRRVRDCIEIGVTDDGVGIGAAANDGTLSSGGRFGLFSIRERLDAIGGRLEIETLADGGTRAVVVAPLEPAKAGSASQEHGT